MRIRTTSLLALIAALVVLAAGQASANLLINPGFEDGTTGWDLVILPYSEGTGFSISDATATAAYEGSMGAQFQVPTTNNFTVHGYFRQVVSGLTPGAEVTVSAWIRYAPLAGYNRVDKYWAYLQTIGGQGSKVAPAQNTAVPLAWTQYTITQTADANGQVDIRLGMNKYATTAAKQCDAFFDSASVTLIPEPGSMVALLSGLVGLVGVGIRRRK